MIRAIGWAFYLASSWTWCIGMMLPALLSRDHGWPGFAVFAIPNIVGAAAMGWVLTGDSSRRFVRDHAAAIKLFSLVTILFQAFYLGWLSTAYNPAGWIWQLILVVTTAWIGFAVLNRLGKPRLGAVIAWSISIACAIKLWTSSALDTSLPATGVAADSALWLLPVSTLGFLACPYLDVTFHTARQHLSKSHARLAFTLGFGVIFAAMICLTYLARNILAPAGSTGFGQNALAPIDLGKFYIFHALVQLAFTARLHADTARTNRDLKLARLPVALAITIGIAIGVGMSFVEWPAPADVHGREVAYKIILSAYGLLFPAYLLIAGVRGFRPPTRSTWTLLAAVVVLASPFYWIGFIDRESRWLAIGFAIVVAGGLAASLLPQRRERLAHQL
ncbi:MAG: hypothetical protein AAGI17_05610 [Planctomycetota bacterium]